MISIFDVTRRLRNLQPLHGPAFIVGGIVTEGYSWRDIDVICRDPRDMKKIKRAMAEYAPRIDFMIHKREPTSQFFIKIIAGEPKSSELHSVLNAKAKYVPQFEFAGPDVYDVPKKNPNKRNR